MERLQAGGTAATGGRWGRRRLELRGNGEERRRLGRKKNRVWGTKCDWVGEWAGPGCIGWAWGRLFLFSILCLNIYFSPVVRALVNLKYLFN